MESKITDEQKMIYDVLKSSSKPIMAKKIARLIYNRFDGYRMSRFMVRDILWKEMKNTFDYNQENYTYQLKRTEENTEIEKIELEKKGDNASLIVTKLKNKEGHEVVSNFKSFIKSNYLGVNSGNKKFDDLIKLVVKDNIITPSEEAFLIEKSHEFGLSPEIVETIKRHVYSNNPYLDNLIHLIFEDGIVSEKELVFLKEKEVEHNFSKSFVNYRFWQIGICFYIKKLIKYDDFLRLIQVWEVGRTLEFDLVNSDTWMILNLDIHKSENIEDIIKRALITLQRRLEIYIKTKFNFDSSVMLRFFEVLNLEYKYREEEEIEEQKLPLDHLITILKEEKKRIGDPAADLLAENILFRLKK